MEPQVVVTEGYQRNLIQVDKYWAKDKSQYTIQYEMSDLVYQEFQGLSQKLFAVPVDQVRLLSKELDKPLNLFSKIGASILGVKTKHQFLIFETNKFFMTLDFYELNRIRFQFGDLDKVLETNISRHRKFAEIVKTSDGLQWRRHFKQKQLDIKDILECLKSNPLQKTHSKISYNGSHFSRKVWNDILNIVEKRE